MKKNVVNKIIAAALASALVVSMAACGDTKTSASGSIADASSSADVSGQYCSNPIITRRQVNCLFRRNIYGIT